MTACCPTRRGGTADVIGIVGGGGGVQEILTAMAAQQRDVAFAPATGGPPRRSGPQVLTDSELAALLAAPERDEVEVGGAYFAIRTSVAAGGQRFGTLTLARPEPISFEDEALLRRAAPVLALILAAQAAAENGLWRDRGAEWLRVALAGPGRRTLIRAGYPGIRANRNYVVLYCALRPGPGRFRRSTGTRPCTPGLGPSRRHVVSRRRRPGRHLPCGRSRPAPVRALRNSSEAPRHLPLGCRPRRLAGFESSAVPCVRARRVAMGLLTLQMQADGGGRHRARAQLALLLAAADDSDARRQAEETLRPLAVLPARRAAELRDTMVTFLRHNQQMQRAAQELSMHVDALYLRLESIAEHSLPGSAR